MAVERETRLQSHSKLWYTHRAGRVTASCMKAICHTNVSNPSQSLIKSVYYPEAFGFSSKQTSWGCKHERKGRDMYIKIIKPKHKDHQVKESGFVINPEWPFIGASPDGVIDCSCCGRGVLEIKCPYCHRESSLYTAAAQDPKFCLKESNDSLGLDSTHSYYYQIQTQMFVCNVEYSDFYVCTFANDDEEGIHIERIYKNDKFWAECVLQAEHFFKTCLLPKLLGNWYTRPNVSTKISCEQSSVANTTDTMTYCYCKGPEEGTMIACDNPDCQVEWFHIKCLHLKSTPKGKWYCLDCRKLSKRKT